MTSVHASWTSHSAQPLHTYLHTIHRQIPVYFIWVHKLTPTRPPDTTHRPHSSFNPQIPVYFIWVNKLSYLTYAYTALMQSQLEGLMVSSPADPNAMVDAITLLPPVLQNGGCGSTRGS